MTGHELDDPSTMTRKPDIGIDYETRKTDMTFWSRYDAVRNTCGPTDHWTKMKLRAKERARSALPASINHFEGNMSSIYALPTSTYQRTRPRTVRQLQDSLRTTYNLRAREGFQYWLIEKPKPTPFGRYGMGSSNSVLGLGNAPRT